MLNAKNLGFSIGIIWGVFLFIFTWIGMAFPEYGKGFYSFIEDIYFIYSLTVPGSFVGLIFGFIDGFIGGFLIAWLYNLLQRRKQRNTTPVQ